MEMKRSGSSKFHKWTTIINPRKPRVAWMEGKGVVVRAWGEPDVHQSNVKYDYDIILSPEDVAAVVAALCANGLSEMPQEIHEAFRLKLAGLVRLAACATGVNPIPLAPAVGDGKPA